MIVKPRLGDPRIDPIVSPTAITPPSTVANASPAAGVPCGSEVTGAPCGGELAAPLGQVGPARARDCARDFTSPPVGLSRSPFLTGHAAVTPAVTFLSLSGAVGKDSSLSKGI